MGLQLRLKTPIQGLLRGGGSGLVVSPDCKESKTPFIVYRVNASYVADIYEH